MDRRVDPEEDDIHSGHDHDFWFLAALWLMVAVAFIVVVVT